ncbi:McrC family protein [Smaragdicoccus niigatensis]|uniref:McrC family protein n=1 Tax=Smaragdicoccus niigatensis TaxID=359359 RepID=UPI001FE01B1D|nr:McrC family protein [Smaragdicoccus niigatensis]
MVKERGTASVSRSTYAFLNEHQGFAGLVDDGIVTLVRSKNAGAAIRAGAYVGSAHLEGFGTISIVPKIPGAFEALLEWAVPDDVRESVTPSVVGAGAPILDQFLTRFLDAMARYLTDGRRRQYDFRDRVGAVPHGRLDVRRTVKLESRGRAGVLAYRERHLSPANDLNRFLALALFAAEEYCASVGSPRQLARTRTYASLFEDVDWRGFVTAPLQRTLDLFQNADALTTTDFAHNAVQYGRALLLHLGAWPTDGSTGVTVPHSFFLNLETLFEDAVRNVLASVSPVAKGATLKRTMFTDLPGIYVADPDVVADVDECRIVLDMKYRDLKGGTPDNGAFYQLHSHAKTLGAAAMALVYPLEAAGDDAWTVRALGHTRDKIKSFVVQVDVSRIADGMIGAWYELRNQLRDEDRVRPTRIPHSRGARVDWRVEPNPPTFLPTWPFRDSKDPTGTLTRSTLFDY